MKFSYEAARPGVKSLAQAFLKPAREDSELNEMKGLANIDYLRSKMGESQAKEAETRQRTDYLNDPETFVSQQSGVPLPLAKKFSQFLKSGDYGNIQPATPNDDEGNPNPVTAITEAPELAPFVDKLKHEEHYNANLSTLSNKIDL